MAKMDIKKCCMVGCENVSVGSDGKENKKLFFVFPKDFNLCMLWVQNSGRPEYFEDFAFAGAQPFLTRHICSEHFNESDFVNPKDPSYGLLANAVPNLNFVFHKVDVKEEPFDPEYAQALSGTLLSENELISEIKLEKFENDNCDNANFSYTSTDDSCNDLGAKISTNGAEMYKETEEDKQLSNEFFRKYKNAMRGSNKRANETKQERLKRLKREALRAKVRRSQESEEQKRIRRMKNALRAAFRRKNETPEQRELRKRKDMLRAQRRRKAETETEARIRRYNDAVRAAFRRNNETEEQRMARKLKDIMRAAKRRSMETPEQRETRLRKDRERASKRRMLNKIAEQVRRLDGLTDFGQLGGIVKVEPGEAEIQPLTMASIGSIANQCNESSNIDHLQQVLEFIESKTSKSKKRTRAEKVAELNEKPLYHLDLLENPDVVPCAVSCEDEEGECVDNDLQSYDECENENMPERQYEISDILRSTLPHGLSMPVTPSNDDCENGLSMPETPNKDDCGNDKSPERQYEITDISQSTPSHEPSVTMNGSLDHRVEPREDDSVGTLLETEIVWV